MATNYTPAGPGDSTPTSTGGSTASSGSSGGSSGGGGQETTQNSGTPAWWAHELLQRLGFPTTSENVKAIVAWEAAEGGHWNNSAAFNPLNTTQPEPGSGTMNGVGVRVYDSWEQGLDATVQTLRSGNYGTILAALQNGHDAQAVADAVVHSKWGTKSISIGSWKAYANATGSGYGSGASGNDNGGTDQQHLSQKQLEDEYGFSAAFFNLDPSLKKLIQGAVSGQWSADKFQAELKGTDWYKTHSSAQRLWAETQTSDPAEAESEVKTLANKVFEQAGQLGARLHSGQALQIARDMLSRGLDQTDIPHILATYITAGKGGNYAGQAGTLDSQIKQQAADYGVPLSDKARASYIQKIVGGNLTMDAVTSFLKDQAKSAYSSISKQIDQGMTVRDVMDPYVQTMAQTLELDPSTVGLNDKWIKQALQTPDQKGNLTLMPLWQFEQTVKSDPRWATTKNANDDGYSFLRNLGQMFGKAV